MTILGRLMRFALPSTKESALAERINDATAATAEGEDVVRRIVETSNAEAAEAVELSDKTRERLARLEARRVERQRMDPHVKVVMDTMRMMEGRS